jgi:hypothetical protein
MILTHQTRIAVKVVINDDTGNVAALIMALTALIGLLVRLGQFINELALWVNDFNEAARFTHTVVIIGFKALAWGIVGVRL